MTPPPVTWKQIGLALLAFLGLGAWLARRKSRDAGVEREVERSRRADEERRAEAEAQAKEARARIAADLKAKVEAAKARRDAPEEEIETINRWAGERKP